MQSCSLDTCVNRSQEVKWLHARADTRPPSVCPPGSTPLPALRAARSQQMSSESSAFESGWKCCFASQLLNHMLEKKKSPYLPTLLVTHVVAGCRSTARWTCISFIFCNQLIHAEVSSELSSCFCQHVKITVGNIQLGHSNPQITAQSVARLLPRFRKEATAAWD